jgi:hypothetical protein
VEAANLIVEIDGDLIPFCAASGGIDVGIDGLTFRVP